MDLHTPLPGPPSQAVTRLPATGLCAFLYTHLCCRSKNHTIAQNWLCYARPAGHCVHNAVSISLLLVFLAIVLDAQPLWGEPRSCVEWHHVTKSDPCVLCLIDVGCLHTARLPTPSYISWLRLHCLCQDSFHLQAWLCWIKPAFLLEVGLLTCS